MKTTPKIITIIIVLVVVFGLGIIYAASRHYTPPTITPTAPIITPTEPATPTSTTSPATSTPATTTPPVANPPASPVSISSLAPESGEIGTMVTITGAGFSGTGNIVNFDTQTITDFPFQFTHTITFKVPSTIAPHCDPGMACPMYVRLVSPGKYNVSVTNAEGETSNTAVFTVTQ